MAVTALYERLSNRSAAGEDSQSIVHQKEYLEQWAAEHDCLPFRHYTDDGYTGTDFRRPAFQRMLRDIQEGTVDTVIVKDLSRFGRNWQESTFYLNKVFPSANVRFIAVLNGVDTQKKDEDLTSSMMHLINEWYSKELSRKLRLSVRRRTEQGHRLSSRCIYGYVPDPKDKDIRLPDPVAAEIVRYIFRLHLEGKTDNTIARQLSEEKIPSRNDYYCLRGWIGRYAWQTQLGEAWQGGNIWKMRHNEEYMGTKILLRKYEGRRDYPDDHEPLVPSLLFHLPPEIDLHTDPEEFWQRLNDPVAFLKRAEAIQKENRRTHRRIAREYLDYLIPRKMHILSELEKLYQKPPDDIVTLQITVYEKELRLVSNEEKRIQKDDFLPVTKVNIRRSPVLPPTEELFLELLRYHLVL